MKIAFFSDCYLDLTGGITTSINAQKKELERRGHTVEIFSSAFPRSENERNQLKKQHVFPVPSCRVFGRMVTPIARRPAVIEKWLLKNHPELHDFDIFYVHYEAGCSIAGMRLGKELGIPVVQVMHGREDMGETNIIPFGLRTFVARALNTFHSWYIPHRITVKKDDYLADNTAKAKMWTLMVNHANFADYVLTPSEHFKQKLAHYGVMNAIEVMPNGVSDEVYESDLKPRTLKKGETLKIIWHSRVSAEKRIMPLLHALTDVEGDYRLDVFGSGGDYFRARRYVREHRLDVVFHGNAGFKSVYRKILDSHLDVLVSYNFDTFGMTLIEAESAGVPTLFVDPDMKEILPEGGYLFAKNPSSSAMAAAINDIIENPDKVEEMSRVLLAHRDEVRVSRCVDKLEKIFESIKK